jgi:acetylornithine aminotransferase/acetylornithine/N-succinyldiaminopimelate aminotransferase
MTNEVASCFKPGMHGSTFGGGPLASAVACTVIDQIEKRKLLRSNRELGMYFVKQLERLQKKHDSIREVRGLGLMVAADLDSSDRAKEMVAALLKAGVIINRTHETALRFLPPYVIRKKHIDEVVDALDKALKQTTKSSKKSQQQPKASGSKKRQMVAQGSTH